VEEKGGKKWPGTARSSTEEGESVGDKTLLFIDELEKKRGGQA